MTDLREQLQTTLGDAYVLDQELGGGGMSRVFLAHDKALGRRVVVKILLPTLAAGVSVERFRREILLAAKLQHPHIVPVHTAGESFGLPYFTMPFVEGESLRARISREGELPLPEVMRLLRDVASALSYAHAQGVIHRDIKPDNVLLATGSAVVADFGVAKAISASTTGDEPSRITSMGIALGTPAYMAPEQATGDPSMDHRVDIYAFGVMAYEMLAGKPPFTGRSAQGTLLAQVTEKPVLIEVHRPSVPPALSGLVMRCLEKHASDRPTVADDLLHALDAMTTPSGGSVPTAATVASRTPTPTTLPALVAPRVPRWLGPAIGAAILVAGAVLVGRNRARESPGSLEVAAPARSADTASVVVPTPPPGPPVPASGTPLPPPPGAADRATGAGSRPSGRPAPPAAVPAAVAMPDTETASQLRRLALDARRSAVAGGAASDRLASGDSVLARGDSLRKVNRAVEAAVRYSMARGVWESATAAASASRPAAAGQAQPAAGQAQPPPITPPGAEPRPLIRSVVASYAAAVESRSIARIRDVYPGLTPAQEQGWRQFFEDVSRVQVTLDITDLQVTGDNAQVTIGGVYEFANSTTRRAERQNVVIRMSLRRQTDGNWIVTVIS